MKRREFIRNTAIGLGGMAFFPHCIHEVSPYTFLSSDEANCVIALTNQIIPEDEYGPGAVYANVVNYIDRQLTQVFITDQNIYRSGITALQAHSKLKHKKSFESLSFQKQHSILLLVESGTIETDQNELKLLQDFFNKIIDHTMQGFYGSPRHGGNKDYISYRLMNLEYPLVIGQNRYKKNNG